MTSARGYRAASVADLSRWVASAADDAIRWRLIAEFLEEYRHEPASTRFGLLTPEPPSTGDERWDVLLAGLAEHLAARDGRGGPVWSEDRRLDAMWFPFDSPAARVDAFVHAPASFRRRGVFIAPQELEVA
jgi:hypothetical protein